MKQFLSLFISSICICSVYACSTPIHITRSRLMMGHVPVIVSIKTNKINQNKAIETTEEAYTIAQALENKLSEYNVDSEISCLNREAGKKYCSLSSDTLYLLNLAQVINQKTKGAFDIRYPSKSKQGKSGSILLIANEAKLNNSQTRIGIASLSKGYILDRMAETFQSKGFEALINAGSDIRAIGGPWKVSIQIPGSDYNHHSSNLEIKNAALTSSGNFENKNNIIDPKTSLPIQNKNAVSVLAPMATLANALSTSLYVMGPQGNKLILDNFPGTKIFWINEKGNTTNH